MVERLPHHCSGIALEQCHSHTQHSLSCMCFLGCAKWVIIQAILVSPEWNTILLLLMVQLFDLSLCPQFKFTVKQQLNNKNVYFFSNMNCWKSVLDLPEPQNPQMQNVLLTQHKLNAVLPMWASYNLLFFKLRGCIFIHMDSPSSHSKSYMQQQSQGLLSLQTEETLTIVFVMSGYGCRRMHSIKFIILSLFVDHGSRYYSLNIGEISFISFVTVFYKYTHICSTTYLCNMFSQRHSSPNLRRMKGWWKMLLHIQ